MAKIAATKLSSLVDAVIDVNPAEKQFVRDLELAMVYNAESGVRVASKTFKPSSLGGCERNIYFQLTGVEPTADNQSPTLIGICESGTDRHIRLQTHIIDMRKFGIDCEYIDVEDFVKSRNLTDIEIISKSGIETKCYNKKYNISFLTDGIIRYKGVYYILEIKTETSRKFKEHDTYRPEHRVQGITYKLSFGIDKVLYLYENRDNTQHKAFIFEVTEKDTKEIVDKISYINGCVATGEVPPKTKETIKCRYCPYLSACAIVGE